MSFTTFQWVTIENKMGHGDREKTLGTSGAHVLNVIKSNYFESVTSAIVISSRETDDRSLCEQDDSNVLHTYCLKAKNAGVAEHRRTEIKYNWKPV